MNTKFDFSRFGRLFLKEIVDNRKDIFKGVFLNTFLIGVLGTVMSMTKMPYDFFFVNNSSGMIFFLAFFLVFVFNTINLSQKIGNKDKRMYYLGFPATSLEKFFSSLGYTLIVLPVCIAGSLFLGNMLGTFIMSFYIEGPVFLFNPVVYFQRNHMTIGYILPFMLLVHSLAFLGSYIWTQKAFLKIMMGVLTFLTFSIIGTIFISQGIVKFVMFWNTPYVWWTVCALIPVNWWLAYLRLTEMEVVSSKI